MLDLTKINFKSISLSLSLILLLALFSCSSKQVKDFSTINYDCNDHPEDIIEYYQENSKEKTLGQIYPVFKYIKSCSENGETLEKWSIENAQKGHAIAQYIRVEYHNATVNQWQSIKWARILSNKNDISAKLYLKSHYDSQFVDSTEQNYLKLLRNIRHELKYLDDKDKAVFIFEDFLYEVLYRSKSKSYMNAAYDSNMAIGTLNFNQVFKNKIHLNNEFGEFGFSFRKAEEHYLNAKNIAVAESDKPLTLKADYSLFILYHVANINRCIHFNYLKGKYRELLSRDISGRDIPIWDYQMSRLIRGEIFPNNCSR